MYVFGYGSLMQPESLRSTLPMVDVDACVPAVVRGYSRRFGVAFPNDGSQPDKQFFDAAGGRPEVVLFCDLTARPQAWVNGICIPVDAAGSAALRRRELRYDPRPVSAIEAYDGTGLDAVTMFIGRPEFTAPGAIARGVVGRAYLAAIEAGARYWDARCPGFHADYLASTSPPERVVTLRRVDR